MKLTSKNGKKILKMSKDEWVDIGRNIGWLEKKAQEQPVDKPQVTPQEVKPGKPMIQCLNCYYKGDRSEFVDAYCPKCDSTLNKVVR